MLLVRFELGEHPCFSLPSDIVPEGFYHCYVLGDDVYAYLNAHLAPSDIVSVLVETDGKKSTVIVMYNLRDDILESLPSFEPIVEADYGLF